MPKILTSTQLADEHQFHNVACPFCGLACDDLTLNSSLELDPPVCSLASRWFSHLAKNIETSPRVEGKDATLTEAFAAAAALIRQAKFPHYDGMMVDVAAAQAVVALAEKSGGVVTHATGQGVAIDTQALQANNAILTTLTETRNRADVVLLFGTTSEDMPRFFERILQPHLQSNLPRRIFLVGEAAPGCTHCWPCELESFPEVLSILCALAEGQTHNDSCYDTLMQEMKKASYGVLAWSAGRLPQSSATLIVSQLMKLIWQLNKDSRWSGLPLGGHRGDLTAHAVHLWRTGLPLGSCFGPLGVDYDGWPVSPNSGDLKIWIASLDDRKPSQQSHIVLAPPSVALDFEPKIFIPVATPGIHHSGHFVRSDQAVMVPLKKLMATNFPSLAQVVEGICQAL